MKIKIITLLICLVIGALTMLGTLYLDRNGLLDSKFIGLSVGTLIPLVFKAIVIILIVCDFMSIRFKKKKYGEIKFVLKRANKRNQIIAFFVLMSIFILEAILILSIRDVEKTNISPLFMFGMLALMYGYHNIEKEGLADNCIYQWGIPTKWDNVNSYDYGGRILTFNVTKKFLGMTQKLKIPFIVNIEEETKILEHVSSRMGKIR